VDIPTDFVESLIIHIPKKTSALKCEQYRTISLLSHASKIFTKIMYKRMERKLEEILAIRLIMEKRIRKDKSTIIAFVDIDKAFDNVNWEIMFKIMKRVGYIIVERKLLYQLYKNGRYSKSPK
jgi:hypothetical protein